MLNIKNIFLFENIWTIKHFFISNEIYFEMKSVSDSIFISTELSDVLLLLTIKSKTSVKQFQFFLLLQR